MTSPSILFPRGIDTDTVQLGNIKTVHDQANYTNAILNTIAEQLNQHNAKTDSKKEAAQKDMESPCIKPSSFTECILKPFVKLDSIPISIVESLPTPKSPNHDLLRKISEQIEAIDKRKALACIDKTCQEKVDSTCSSSEEEAASSSSDSEEVIATIQKTFKDKEPFQNIDKKSLLLLIKSKIATTLGLGIIILDLLLQTSDAKNEDNLKIETSLEDYLWLEH